MKRTEIWLCTMWIMMAVLFIPQASYAQSEKHLTLAEMSTSSWPNPFRPSAVNQEGTPFLFDEWLPGTINSLKGKTYDVAQMKFNLFHGRLLIKLTEQDKARMMVPLHIKSFSIIKGDSSYSFQRHLVPVKEVKHPMDAFFIEMVTGRYYLLAKPGKQGQREEKNVMVVADEHNNVKYVDIVDYFIKNPLGNITPFKNNKKVKTEIFGDDLAALEKFVKQNKLRWGKFAHLVKIVERANAQ